MLLCLLLVSTGNAQNSWRRTYGGAGSDAFRSCVALSGGDILLAGSTGSFTQNSAGYLLRISAGGELIWSRLIQGNGLVLLDDIVELPDGRIAAAGTRMNDSFGYDGFIALFGPDGSLLNERIIGGPDWDFLRSVCSTDHGFVAAGDRTNEESGLSQPWFIGFSHSGELLWERTIPGDLARHCHDVVALADGDLAAAGVELHTGGDEDAFAMRCTPEGELLWVRTFATDSLEAAYSVCEGPDSRILIAGSSNWYAGFKKVFVAAVEADGEVAWVSSIGQIDDYVAHQIAPRSEGGYMLACHTKAFGFGGKEMYLLLLDENGQFVFGTTFGGSSDDVGYAIDRMADGGYLLAGETNSFGPGPQAGFVVRTRPDGLTSSETVIQSFDPVDVGLLSSSPMVRVGPNPLQAGQAIQVQSSSIQLRFELHSASGASVLQGVPIAGQIGLGDVRPGTYLLRLSNEHHRYSTCERIIILP